MNAKKHGIEIRFGKGRSLKILSYAVWLNGHDTVSHATTRANRLTGIDLANLVKIERERNPELPII